MNNSDLQGNTRTASATRESVLAQFYADERRACGDAMIAHERMAEFAKRLDEHERRA